MADWNTPDTSSTYTNVLAYLKDRDVDLAKMFDGVGSNVPTGAIKFSATNKRFEKWSGAAWAELIVKASDKYDINVDRVDGCDVAGTATANTIPVRDASGAVTGFTLVDGTAAAPSCAFSDDPDTGIYRVATNTLGFAAAGARVGQFDTSKFSLLGGAAFYHIGTVTAQVYLSSVTATVQNSSTSSLYGFNYNYTVQPTGASLSNHHGLLLTPEIVGSSAIAITNVYGFNARIDYGFTVAGYTIDSHINYIASDPIITGTAPTIQNQYGFYCGNLTQGTNRIAAFYSAVSSGTNKWNAYLSGAAPNYLNGKTYIGNTYAPLTAALSTDGRLNINTNYISTTAYEAGVSVTNYRNRDDSPAVFDLAQAKSDTPGNKTAVGSAAELVRIRFLGADGTNFCEAGRIECLSDGTVSSGVVSGRMRLGVADDLGVLRQRLLIDYSGVLWVAQDTQRGPALTASVPAKMRIGASAYTDTATSASGTVTHGVGTSIPSFQIAASNTGVTYTTASTLYVSGAPTAGTNVTITSPYSVYVAGGNEIHGGSMRIGGTTAPGATLDVTGSVAVTIGLSSDGFIKSTSATSGIGYSTGAGGTVTQTTSKSAAVTLNKICGEVTMHNAALAADTVVSFDVINSTVTPGDRILINHVNSGTMGAYTVNAYAGGGKIVVTVRNVTGGSLSEALVLGFAVFKAVLS